MKDVADKFFFIVLLLIFALILLGFLLSDDLHVRHLLDEALGEAKRLRALVRQMQQEHQARVHEMEIQVQDLRQQVEACNHEMQDAQSENQALHGWIHHLEEQVGELEWALQDARAKTQEMGVRSQDLLQQLGACNQMEQEHQTEIREAKMNLQGCSAEKDRLLSLLHSHVLQGEVNDRHELAWWDDERLWYLAIGDLASVGLALCLYRHLFARKMSSIAARQFRRPAIESGKGDWVLVLMNRCQAHDYARWRRHVGCVAI